LGFKKIPEPKKKSIYVAEQIIAAIRRGEYKQGDKLPPERTIAQQMNVSRNCVREALSALQITHILATRVGAGTYVDNPVGSEVDIEKALRLARDGKDLLEIWEARKEIEIALIKLAINRATPEDIAKISYHLEEMRAAVSVRDINRYLDANKAFHLAIAAGADNLPLRNAVEVLQDYTDKQILNDVNKAYVVDGMEKSLQEHEDILNAIRNGDNVAGTKAIKAHFKELEDYFESKYLGGIKR